MYKEFFGFKEHPFNVTSDPHFLFMSSVHTETLSHMIYGIEYRKGFITITGEIGTGKTTLCRQLINKMKPNVHTALILNPTLSASQLLRAVAEDFGIEAKSSSKISILGKLNVFLMNKLKEGGNVVLIIDEAQNLSLQALEQVRLLSNLETEKEKLLQIVLVGQPELSTKLRSPKLTQLKQRISVCYHITALSEKDLTEYIRFRLRQAGSTGEPVDFLAESLALLYKYSHGIPRLINLLCDKALLLGYIQNTRHITPQMIETVHNELEAILV